MKGDYDFKDETDINSKYYSKTVLQKISSLKFQLIKKDEELKIYKERLKEIESAFCYNLNLLSDRDLELDALENQLKIKFEQLQKLIFRQKKSEETIKKLEHVKGEEVKSFKSHLLSKEQIISELERKNQANLNTLKQTLEDVRVEYEEKISKLIWAFDSQKKDLENHFQMIIDVNARNHLKEMNEISKQMKAYVDQVRKEKEKAAYLETQNNYLKQHITQAENEFRVKENSLLQKIGNTNKRYFKVNRELQTRKINKKVDHKETLFKPEVKSIGVQKCDEVDSAVILQKTKREENNLCEQCLVLMGDIRDGNISLRNEIKDLKKIMEDDRHQKAEEEFIIQNLETSVYSLKERLLSELLQKKIL